MFAWPIARKPWQHTYIRAASVADRDCVPATVVADMQLLHEAKDNDTLFGQIWNMSLYMKIPVVRLLALVRSWLLGATPGAGWGVYATRRRHDCIWSFSLYLRPFS